MTDGVGVLLIEDNPGDVRLVEELLDGATDGSRTATDESGLRIGELRHADTLDEGLRALDETTDVVLLDLGLPDSTGIDTLEAVRDRSRAVAIVVLTGLSDEATGARAVQQGAQEYLVKDELTPPLLGRALRHAIERKKFERTRAALHDASRDVIHAESGREVGDLVVETAVDVLDQQGVGVYLFDGSTNVLRPVAYTDYIEELFGELPSFSADDTAITWQAFVTGETITLDDVLESEYTARQDTPVRSGIWVPLGDHGVLAIVSEAVGQPGQQTQQLADHLAATAEAALDRVEREAALRESEQELARRNRQLERLDRMNALIREIDQILVQATTRAAIEQAVCDRVAEDDQFVFAWIGELAADGTLEPRAWAGANQGYLDTISPSVDAANGPPSVTAATTDSVVVVPNVVDDLRQEPWRKTALTEDFHSAIAIPLTYNDLSYGVLTAFADEPGVLGTVSNDVARELGETIANAINSVETRQALLAETVVEVKLAIREPDDPLSRLARETDCQLEYGGVVPQSDGTIRLFFTARGESAGSIETVADGIPGIRQLRRISDPSADSDGTSRFEMTVSEPTIPSSLVECGAVAQSIELSESEVVATVELPDAVDVRTFLNRLENTYPGTELIARRDTERTDRSQRGFDGLLREELTDRQLEALQTAYLSGYFEWPRERTGEEVAETLDISQPTLNAHLRSAERKLCALLFDGAPSSPE
ncbi:bacterio-opsin activator domain-containing protein [Halosimplex aquaticum]|uniref:Bacterio-opsin activator domain-containing protein n=1 Tax=Halosimplex aquaticum TaxID=3026162 RepID=A0ABD5Y2W2_9EURY|nr:bacterio-opsin activator domain-containing protein [Halosimplex aquaticum]